MRRAQSSILLVQRRPDQLTINIIHPQFKISNNFAGANPREGEPPQSLRDQRLVIGKWKHKLSMYLEENIQIYQLNQRDKR